MAAPINSFEIVESIRFFAQLVATEGVSERVKTTCNSYIEKLIDALSRSVDETTAGASGIKLM